MDTKSSSNESSLEEESKSSILTASLVCEPPAVDSGPD